MFLQLNSSCYFTNFSMVNVPDCINLIFLNSFYSFTVKHEHATC